MVLVNNIIEIAGHIIIQCEALLIRGDLSDMQREFIDAIYRNANRYNSFDTNVNEQALLQRDGLHHTLRSPLAPIKGYAEMLLMDAAGPLNSDMRQLVATIRDHADQMTMLSDAMVG